jgi:hypothetical protein
MRCVILFLLIKKPVNKAKYHRTIGPGAGSSSTLSACSAPFNLNSRAAGLKLKVNRFGRRRRMRLEVD